MRCMQCMRCMKIGDVCGVVLGLLLVSIATAIPAAATIVVKLDLAELTRQAALIVEARAIEAHGLSQDGELFTLVALEVQRTFKGTPAEEIQVLLPGGLDLDGPVPIASIWVGQPLMTEGSEYILFLHDSDEDGYHTLVGFSQGQLEIRYDETGQALVAQDLRGLRHPGTESDLGRFSVASLATVESEIRRHLARSSREHAP